ncbi:spermidine synthase [Streptomyces sp. NPDC054784]
MPEPESPDGPPPDGPPYGEPLPESRPVTGGTAKLLPDVDRPRAWLLTVDGAPQSYVDLDDPLHLEFEYARRLGHVLDLAGPPGPLDVLHLGGGALTLPRYTAATRPGSRQHVVEYDRALLAFVTERLPLPPDPGLRVEAGDARTVLEGLPAASADVVVGDVYGGSRVPAHLTTLPYARAVARVLRPDGVYAGNLADASPFRFLASQLATFAAVFPHLCLIAEPAVLRGRRFGNTVLLASRTEPPVRELARRTAADAFPARVVHGAALRRMAADAAPVRDGAAERSPVPPEGAFGVDRG